MKNYIPFKSAVFIVVPELRKVEGKRYAEIIEKSKLSAGPYAIKKSGLALVTSLVISFLLVALLFLCFAHAEISLLIPFFGALGAFFSSFLYSIFLAIILAPEIRRFIQ